MTKYGVVGSTDTLRSVEFITGTDFADIFNAGATTNNPQGFSSNSTNAGSAASTFNEFEGRGGNDTIIGNGNTRISYLHATAGVTVDIAAGVALGDASVGHDTFSGVNSVRGSYFDDFLYGSNNPAGTVENFEGRGGNDYIDGRGGFDRAVYANEDFGINVQLAAGTVRRSEYRDRYSAFDRGYHRDRICRYLRRNRVHRVIHECWKRRRKFERRCFQRI